MRVPRTFSFVDLSGFTNYTAAFGDCRAWVGRLEAAGLETEYVPYFFGCASGVVGRRR